MGVGASTPHAPHSAGSANRDQCPGLVPGDSTTEASCRARLIAHPTSSSFSVKIFQRFGLECSLHTGVSDGAFSYRALQHGYARPSVFKSLMFLAALFERHFHALFNDACGLVD